MNKKGFSLIEILIYLGIISIISVVFFRILGVSTRVQVSQVAENEVANQTNFIMQTIQHYIRESSLVVTGDDPHCSAVPDSANDLGVGVGENKRCLRLRMPDPGPCTDGSGPEDPTDNLVIISMVDSGQNKGAVQLQERCGEISFLTTDKVKDPNNALTFRKYTNYPGHDTVEISLTLNYHSDNPQAQAKRVVQSAISRVSAATFDSDLISGTDQFGAGIFDIGQASLRWANAFVGNLDVSGSISAPNNYDNSVNGRGMMTLYGKPGAVCDTLCSAHGLTCFQPYNFFPSGVGGSYVLTLNACGSPMANGGLCTCN